MKTNKQIRGESVRETFEHWSTLAMASFLVLVLNFIGGVLEPPMSINSFSLALFLGLMGLYTLVGIIYTVVIVWPIGYGYEQMFLLYTRDRNIDVFHPLFKSFQDLRRSVVLTFLHDCYILLWSLLLVVPGIVRFYSYRMSFFIALDHPQWVADRCIHESRIMMRGHKWELFKLDLSFIGWILLSVLTCGIGLLWLSPMMGIATAKFYEELRRKQRGEMSEEEEAASDTDDVPNAEVVNE